jgi:hypothetical protein
MNSSDITGVIFGIMLIGIPMIGFTAKMVMKPLVDALIRLREAGIMTSNQQQQQLLADRRLTDLQEELHNLQQTVQRLVDAEAFNRQLGAGEKRASLPPQAAPAEVIRSGAQ